MSGTYCFHYATVKEVKLNMEEIKNLDGKRVCDIAHDKKAIEIGKKDCITRITANSDGTLRITNLRKA